MRLSNIYTKGGDKGNTKLADGSDIKKSDDRLEAYGTVDELNSLLGVLSDQIRENSKLSHLIPQLAAIQHELFYIGGELASPPEMVEKYLKNLIDDSNISRLEKEIDTYNETLPPLENFVLPGGHISNSTAHLCRTICRRAERRVIKVSEKEPIRPTCIRYLNRLSDWLFIASRHISQKLEINEIIWNQSK